MSDLRSPVVGEGQTIRTFSASAVAVVQNMAPTRRGQALTLHEQLEEQRRSTLENAEKTGFDRGHAKGFLQGYEQGKELGVVESKQELADTTQAQIDQFTKELGHISDELQKRIEAWFTASEERMTDLAMTAVRKILAAELAISRESALEIVKEALKDVTHSRHARIRINPFDAPTLRENRLALMTVAGSLRDVEFVSDSSIPGGCIIETDGGVVDATTTTKLELIENQMKLAS